MTKSEDFEQAIIDSIAAIRASIKDEQTAFIERAIENNLKNKAIQLIQQEAALKAVQEYKELLNE